MEVKLTLFITLILCFCNTAFFLAYDENKAIVANNLQEESNTPIFYLDQEKDVDIVKVQETAEEIAQEPQEQNENDAVPSYNLPVSYKPTPPPSNDSEAIQDPSPEQPAPPEAPTEDPEPVGGGIDPYGDIGGGSG